MQMMLSHLPSSIYLIETTETREKLFICNKLDARIFFFSFHTARFIVIGTAEVFKGVDISGKTQVCVQRSPGTILWQNLTDCGDRCDGS